LQQGGTLLSVLQSRKRTLASQRAALEDARSDLGLPEGDVLSPVCVAYALIKLNVLPEEVSRLLSWREFEALAGALLRISGFEVRENVVLTRPRAQIDLVAYGTSMVLSVDCKHYRRAQGHSSLKNFAAAQLKRSALLRRKSSDLKPIVSMILSMSEPEGEFVEGVAIVPLRSLRSFLTSLDSYVELLELK